MMRHSGVWVMGILLVAGAVAVAGVSVGPPPGGATEVTPAQNKLLAMRAAQADALRKLAEQVYGLEIESGTFVRDFVAESDQIKTATKAFIRGAKMVGEPRYYADGACEVDYELPLLTVITELKRIADGYVKKGKFTGNYFEQIKQHTKLSVIRVTGSGAPRADVDPGEVMEGGIAVVTKERYDTVRKIPVGWENVQAQGRLLAMRAAQLDAYRNIAERVYGVLIESQTEVKDFVAESDFVNAFAQARLVGVKVTGERYMSDQIAECDVELPLETIVTTTQTIVDGKMKNGKFKGDVFQKTMQDRKLSVVKATGRGVPPARFISGAVSTLVPAVGLPDWAGKVCTAKGSAAVNADRLKENEAQAWLEAERAAEVIAKRNLAEEVNGVRIDSTTLVKDFVAQHDEIRSDMSTFLMGSRRSAVKRNEDGTVEVEVELPLERLALIVSRAKGGK